MSRRVILLLAVLYCLAPAACSRFQPKYEGREDAAHHRGWVLIGDTRPNAHTRCILWAGPEPFAAGRPLTFYLDATTQDIHAQQHVLAAARVTAEFFRIDRWGPHPVRPPVEGTQQEEDQMWSFPITFAQEGSYEAQFLLIPADAPPIRVAYPFEVSATVR